MQPGAEAPADRTLPDVLTQNHSQTFGVDTPDETPTNDNRDAPCLFGNHDGHSITDF